MPSFFRSKYTPYNRNTYDNYKEELKMEKIVVKLLSIVTVLVLAPFTIGGMVVTACFELYKGIWKVIVGK